MVHPKIAQAYSDADFEYIHSAHDLAEITFNRMTNDHTIREVITKITRIKFPNGKEYVYYEVRKEDKDHVGNEHHFTTDVGIYRKPIFQNDFDPSSRKIVGKAIARHEMVYEIPFDRKKLDKIAAKGIENEMTLYVEAGGR